MPKAKGNGGKKGRRGKGQDDLAKRELIFKEDGQEYAQVQKMLGNGRIEAKCQDGETRLAQIRGQLRKKVWINVGDIILLSLREFQDDRADVIHRYTPEEARNLKTYGELKNDFTIHEGGAGGDEEEVDDDGVEFGEDDVDDICVSSSHSVCVPELTVFAEKQRHRLLRVWSTLSTFTSRTCVGLFCTA